MSLELFSDTYRLALEPQQHAVVPNTRRHHLMDRVLGNVEDGSKVYTDALKSYDNLGAY